MRIAISGSHGVGKSTLIDAFLERRPGYVHQPEAYETLGDDVAMTDEGPTPEALEDLLRWTITAVAEHPAGADVIHERSPADYLAYAAASRRSWGRGEAEDFVARFAALVASSLVALDLIAIVPLSRDLPAREGEDGRFRRRADRELRRIVLDGDRDVLSLSKAMVIELPASPDRRLAALLAAVDASAAPRAGRG